MIRYIENKDIDKKKWDECIRGSVNGMIYAYSWWLEIVAENWHGLVEDDYQRVFPLIAGRKWNIDYLYQPVFTQQLGIFSKNILTDEIVSSFLKTIPAHYKFAEINLNTLNKVRASEFKIAEWHNYELDLINSYDNLSRNYSTNIQRNLKKARSAGLKILKNIKPDEIIDLFRSNRGKKISSLKDEHYNKLRRLIYFGIYKGLMHTVGVYSDNNQLLAGAVFAKSKNKAIFLFSGLSEEGRESHALVYLIDAFIKENALQHLTLDFEGSNSTNLARFYQGFGSSLCLYPHIVINRLPFVSRFGVNVIKNLRNWCDKLL